MLLKYATAQVNSDTKCVTMLMYGVIGKEIDGHQFANEMDWLGNNVDEITLRINSEGGSVPQGLSIFNSVLFNKAKVTCQIDGMAASMAAPIALAGKKTCMNDFARMMVHNPSFQDMTNLNENDKKYLENMRSLLVDIMCRKGCDKADMEQMMNAETWLTADDCKQKGLIDEIISTGKMQEVNSRLLGMVALSNTHFENYINPQKENSMKILAAQLGRSENASESELLKDVVALQENNKLLTAQVADFKKLSDDLKASIADKQKTEAVALVDGAIANGFFGKEQRESLLKSAEANFDMFAQMITSLKKPVASITAVIAGANAGAGSDETKNFEWYRHNDPQALAEMKTANPETFNKLYEAWEKENA
jgi:ATP-dependent protease ClpP protease subunit